MESRSSLIARNPMRKLNWVVLTIAKVVLSLFILSSNASGQCYSGLYSVGPLPSNDFASLTEAVDSLVIHGMCGEVSIQIESGTYITSLEVPEIVGNNLNNKLIFESSNGLNQSVILQKAGVTNPLNDFVIKMIGGEAVIFKDLTINRINILSNYGQLVSISDTAQFLEFDNVILTSDASTNNSKLIGGIGQVDSLLFHNSNFNGGNGSIYCPLVECTYFELSNCNLTGNKSSLVHLPEDAVKSTIEGNEFVISGSNTSSSVMLIANSSANLEIINNKFYCSVNGSSSSSSGAINVVAPLGSGAQLEINNNFMNCTGLHNKAIRVNGYDSLNCNFNTIRCKKASLTANSINTLNFYNNIVDCIAYTTPLILTTCPNINFDYNSYNGFINLSSINGASYSTLNNFQINTGQDLNSLVHEPLYVTIGDYQLADIILNDMGNAIPGITTDINYTARSSNPDIGCIEFNAPAIEANLVNFGNLSLNMCPGNNALYAQVANHGLTVIDSILFQIEINGVIQTYNWVGTIQSGDTIDVNYLTFDFEDFENYDLSLEIISVNNQSDALSYNNQLSYTNIQTMMSGTYIIGFHHGDLYTMKLALDELEQRKSCGTVIFEFEDGPHEFTNESFPNYPYQYSNINQDSVIFRPMFKNAELDFRSSVFLAGLEFYDCSNFYFEDLVFYGMIENITPGSKSIDISYSSNMVFKNNLFLLQQSTSSQSASIYTSIYMDHVDSVVFEGNEFRNGRSAVSFISCDSVNFTNNVLLDQSAHGIWLDDCARIGIHRNLFDLRGTNAVCGIRTYLSDDYEITHNEIFMNNGYGIRSNEVGSYVRLVANNVISTGTSSPYYWDVVQNVRLINNSFYNSGNSIPIIKGFTGSPSTLYFEVKNNNFKSAGNAGLVFDGVISLNLISDYNAFDSSITEFHPTYPTYGAWLALGHDSSSIQTPFSYSSPTDFRIDMNSLLINGGEYVYDILTDLHGRTRANPPSTGAHEIYKDSVEVGLLSFDWPNGTCGNEPEINLHFVNYGSDTLYNAHFSYNLNVGDSAHFDWNGILPPGDTALIALGVLENNVDSIFNPMFEFHPSITQIDDPTNNTLNFTYTGTPMSGDYTLGGPNPDFVLLKDVFRALERRGVCDSVFVSIHPLHQPTSIEAVSLEYSAALVLSNVENLENNYLWIGSTDSIAPYFQQGVKIFENENIHFQNVGFYQFGVGFNYYYSMPGLISVSEVYTGYNTSIFGIVKSNNVLLESCIFQHDAKAISLHDTCTNITIDNNIFAGTDIIVLVAASHNINNLNIINNTATLTPYYTSEFNSTSPNSAEYDLNDVDFLLMENNTSTEGDFGNFKISNCGASSNASCTNHVKIRNNKFYGKCVFSNMNGTDSSRVEISNNFFSGGAGATPTLQIFGSYIDILHNSIYHHGWSECLDLISIGDTSIQIEKNLFFGSDPYDFNLGGPNVYPPLYSDNNAFSVSVPINAFEQNSIQYNPSTVNNYDLHILPGLNTNPTSSSVILSSNIDIDYQPRFAQTMYGADEVIYLLDLALIEIILENSVCNDSVKFSVVIQNAGINDIDSADLIAEWNGNTYPVNLSNTSLNTQDIDTIYIGTYSTTPGFNYIAECVVSSVNGVADTINSNNSVTDSFTYSLSMTIIDVELCQGDGMTINGAYQTTSGIYPDTLISMMGCDSLVSFDLEIIPSLILDTLMICSGDSVLINNQFEAIPGSYTFIDSSSTGCPFTQTSELIVLGVTGTAINNLTLCAGNGVTIGGVYVTTSGIYYDSLTNVNGCDSVLLYDVNILPDILIDTITICQGDSALINNQWELGMGTYSFSDTNSLGCMITHSTELTVLNTPSVSLPAIYLCEGDSVFVGGDYQFTSGMYHDTLTSYVGCDSVLIQSINLVPNAWFDTVTICFNDSALVNSQFVSVPGTYSYVDSNNFGCVTNNTTELFVLNPLDLTIDSLQGSLFVPSQAQVSYQWVSCPTYSALSNGQNNVYTPSGFGGFAVILDNGVCSDTSDCFIYDNQSGLTEENELPNFHLFPNPSDHFIYIQGPITSGLNVELKDILGRTVLRSSFQQESGIDISSLAPGSYHVYFIDHDHRQIDLPFIKVQ